MTVWSPNHKPFFPIFKGHYKLILGGELVCIFVILLFLCLSFHTCVDVFFWVFQERQEHSNQYLLPLLATSRLWVLDWDLWCIWAFYCIWALCCMCVLSQIAKWGDCWFWVYNVGKPWQKLSLIGLERSTLKSKTKN